MKSDMIYSQVTKTVLTVTVYILRTDRTCKINTHTFAQHFQTLIGSEHASVADVNSTRRSPVCVSAAELTAAAIVFWFCFASHVLLS